MQMKLKSQFGAFLDPVADKVPISYSLYPLLDAFRLFE